MGRDGIAVEKSEIMGEKGHTICWFKNTEYTHGLK